jgi:hypothetical protein
MLKGKTFTIYRLPFTIKFTITIKEIEGDPAI